MLRRLPALLLAVGALALFPAGASARSCAGADARLGAAGRSVVRAALACLHDRARAARRLRPLRRDRWLTRAASGHSLRMVRSRFFGHAAPSGARAAQRVRRAGYAPRRAFAVGENLAWGTGERATPRQVFRAWMASPLHRANVLDRRFRAIGIGVAAGAPTSRATGAATFTVLYGTR